MSGLTGPVGRDRGRLWRQLWRGRGERRDRRGRRGCPARRAGRPGLDRRGGGGRGGIAQRGADLGGSERSAGAHDGSVVVHMHGETSPVPTCCQYATVVRAIVRSLPCPWIAPPCPSSPQYRRPADARGAPSPLTRRRPSRATTWSAQRRPCGMRRHLWWMGQRRHVHQHTRTCIAIPLTKNALFGYRSHLSPIFPN